MAACSGQFREKGFGLITSLRNFKDADVIIHILTHALRVERTSVLHSPCK
jgi:hypothetical protein